MSRFASFALFHLLLAQVLPAQAAAPDSATVATTVAGAVPAAAPRLIVVLTVDQMRADYFQRWGNQLTGGLARFLRQGAFYANAAQDHAITETAPGHSTILSGRFPRSTGITANVLGVNTDSAPLLGSNAVGASPFRFKGTTLVDWLVRKDPRTRVLSVSRKDRGAILPIGRSRQQVYWYASPGLFTTSSYYADSLPEWVRAFNARNLPRKSAGRRWDLLLPAADYPEQDSVAVENGGTGTEVVFPHVMSADSAAAALTLPNYPWMDELTLDFALAGVRALGIGRGPQTDLLNVSLSTLDAVGHRYGPDSREVHDMFLRVDRALGSFLDSLYAERDSNTIVLALTADHGVNPYPEVRSRYDDNRGAGRVGIADIIAVARAAARRAKVDTAAVRWMEGMLYVNRDALRAARVSPEKMAAALAAAVAKVPGVARADTWASLARADTVREAIPRRWLHMLPAGFPADVFVTLKPFWDWEGGPPIANHGSPNDYDAKVPVAFLGPWVRAGRHVEPVRVVDIAPTLAAIAGVTPLERVDGHVLRNALVRAPVAKDR